MSMHLRGSGDMMGQEEGWWQSRTGLEQKLIILSTVLFIVTFSLTIAIIVEKNKSSACPDVTTLAPTDITVSGDTSSEEPPSSTASGATPESTTASESSSAASEASTESSVATESTTASPSTEPTSPTTESSTASPTGETTASSPTNESPPPKEKETKFAESGPGSINARPARYIPSPRVLANVNGEVFGA